ncbi:MAG: glycoside hydrolase family 5 protein [bacterium]
MLLLRRVVSHETTLLFILVFSFLLSCSSKSEDTIIPPPGNEKQIVDVIGQLRVEGTQVIDKDGNPVALYGMSMFWSQWIGKYYNYECIKWLRDDWKCTVIRAALAVESGGYLTNPTTEKEKIKTVVNACIDLGIYVIIDWHDHNAHRHTNEAKTFFTEMANLYGNKPNVLYEIYNEPLQISWADSIKPYAETVIQSIRAIDPDNIIIVGTPAWSQDVDVASRDPLQFDNITYALHYYAATHKQWLRNKATTAMNNGIALFVSEFGTCTSNGNGAIDYTEVEAWFSFMKDHKISWCNWSVADKNETSSALKPGANEKGGWTEDQLSESGKLIRQKIISCNDSLFTSLKN